LVGTKVRLTAEDLERIEGAVVASVVASLRRLGREQIDLIQLHNPLMRQRRPEWAAMAAEDLAAVVRAFQSLERQGKVRFWGITGLGETETLQQVVAAGGFHSVQVVYNLLNPSTGRQVPARFASWQGARSVELSIDTRSPPKRSIPSPRNQITLRTWPAPSGFPS
jgi:aryl-alcohol dehydrogenase-like predicted oxidoreductase